MHDDAYIASFHPFIAFINGVAPVLVFAKSDIESHQPALPRIYTTSMQLDNNDEILAKLMQPSTIDSKITDIKKHLQDVLVGWNAIMKQNDRANVDTQ